VSEPTGPLIQARMCGEHGMYWPDTLPERYDERCPMSWMNDAACWVEHREMIHLNNEYFHDCVMEPVTA
jgi:hypothetical protein